MNEKIREILCHIHEPKKSFIIKWILEDIEKRGVQDLFKKDPDRFVAASLHAGEIHYNRYLKEKYVPYIKARQNSGAHKMCECEDKTRRCHLEQSEHSCVGGFFLEELSKSKLDTNFLCRVIE
jgi:hypothetical protein